MANPDNNGITTSTATITEVTDKGGKLEENGETKCFGSYALSTPVEVGDKVQYRTGKLGNATVVLSVSIA